MASRASLQSKDDSSGEITVEFDDANGRKYAMCASCVWCTMMCVGLNLVVQPCLCYCAVKEFKSQHCTVDDRRIHYNTGWINKKEKTIPLDRVQDIGIDAGCLQRICGVETVLIQTAGAGGDGGQAEAVLQSVKEARKLRARIIERRDAIVLGKGAGNANAAGGGTDFVASGPVTSQPAEAVSMALINEVKALRESVVRIEKHVAAISMSREERQ